ncbi:hypothetical protein D918_05312 [Trichuris suis]|nr:hypothetical protein D918_05312 [Trichuris suis]
MVTLFCLTALLLTQIINGDELGQQNDDITVFDEFYYNPKAANEIYPGRKNSFGRNYAIGQQTSKKERLKQAMKFLCPPIVCNADWRPTKRRVLK